MDTISKWRLTRVPPARPPRGAGCPRQARLPRIIGKNMDKNYVIYTNYDKLMIFAQPTAG